MGAYQSLSGGEGTRPAPPTVRLVVDPSSEHPYLEVRRLGPFWHAVRVCAVPGILVSYTIPGSSTDVAQVVSMYAQSYFEDSRGNGDDATLRVVCNFMPSCCGGSVFGPDQVEELRERLHTMICKVGAHVSDLAICR